MVVVTVHNDVEPGGCLVGFHTQVSIEPSRYAVCLSKANHTYRVAESADTLGVHLLASEQTDLAVAFGGHTEDDQADKFARFDWRPHERSRTPILTDVTHWFVGAIHQRLDAGDHVVFVLDPLDATSDSDTAMKPLRFGSVSSIDPGHDP